jgi:hypothetical protein
VIEQDISGAPYEPTSTETVLWVASVFATDGYAYVTYQGRSQGVALRYRSVHREDVAAMAHVFRHEPIYERQKKRWITSAYGSFAIGWMMTIYGMLPTKRQACFRKIIEEWRAFQAPAVGLSYIGKHPRPALQMAMCHPNRRNWGRGLCQSYYEKGPWRTAYRQQRTDAVRILKQEPREALPPLPPCPRHIRDSKRWAEYMKAFERRRTIALRYVREQKFRRSAP